MKRGSKDDIEALFGHLGLNPDFYKRFSGEPPPVDEQLQRLEERVSVPAPPLQNPEKVPTPPPVNKDRWRLLSENESERVHAPVAETLTFHSVVGGAGLTGILATVARALSGKGQRVLIADGRLNSTLPLYFGVSTVPRGVNSLIVSRCAPIYILLRDLAGQGQEIDDAWLWKPVEELSPEIDRVLLRSWQQVADKTQQRIFTAGASIVVVVPDMRSAVGVRRIAHTIQDFRSRGYPAPAHFLLNKFDASSSLNVDMRNWLSKELGSALLPFVIRRDEKVAEALAQGLTVFDYAPDCPAAEDFQKACGVAA